MGIENNAKSTVAFVTSGTAPADARRQKRLGGLSDAVA